MRKNTISINSALSLLILNINNNILTSVYFISKNPLFSVESNKLQQDGLAKGSGNLIGSPSSPNQYLITKSKIIIS